MATKWSDAEKNALLVSIILASGPVKWDQVVIPPGRTKKACIHVYDSAKKQAADHAPIEAGSSSAPATPKTPRTRKNTKATSSGTATADTTPTAKATPKRKRNTRIVGKDVSASVQEAAESVVKKQKTESEEEAAVNEDEMKGNNEEVAVKEENVESGEEDVKA